LNSQLKKAGAGLLAGMFAPSLVHACACGCGIFDVATSSMFPQGEGGTAFVNYSYQDQNQNRNGTANAPSAANDDKEIRTSSVTPGAQYLFNRSWGMQADFPFVFRYFKSRDDAGKIVSRNWSSLGDISLKGIYTGFSEDLSSGVTFGLKLPTGSFNRDADVVDRDTQIGSGSTDVLLGGFFRHDLVSGTRWQWFAQANLDVPTLTQGDYRPGVEGDAAAGINYRGWDWGRANIAPIAQVIGSVRGRDNGNDADPDNSGYQRILLSPGIEVHLHPVKIYADVEIPVYQNMKGDQLVAPALFKVSLSYMF